LLRVGCLMPIGAVSMAPVAHCLAHNVR
jgi:hypothetical protein